MAVPNSNLAYIGIDRPTLAYRSNTSLTDDTPHFVSGSQNVVASISGWIEKRPGFSDALEAAISAIPGTISRIFFWKRWAGSITNPDCFFCMASSIIAGTSRVYALNLGNGTSIAAQPSFSLLYTDPASSTPFDYQDSNNFVFFGNANTRQTMRKWDGTGAPTLWGLDAPISAPTIALVSGDLPAGLTLNPTTGVLSGTPTGTASTSLTVTVTDAAGATAVQLLSLTIDPPGLEWTTRAGQLPPAIAGTGYSYTLAVQSGTGAYTYALNSGTLPAGITLNASTGALSGTPTTASLAASTFSIKATDSATPTAAVAIRAFSLYVGSSVLSISPTTIPSPTVGTAYSQQITASGGTSPYTFALVGGGLPVGLTLSSTGLISGTPTSPSATSIILRVTDSTPIATEFSLPISVTPTSLAVITTSLPDAQQGVAYNQQILAAGGTTPYTYAYTAGGLTAQTGYQYGYTYTSIYGHESSMSPLSDSTGLFTDQDVATDVISSADLQVSGINLYRTTDGGDADPAAMRLVTSLTNTSAEYDDSTEDQYLGSQTGPALYVNDPPQPLCGFVWSNGRIWGFNKQATWFTGNEEVTNGIPVECMSDAKNGNFYQWPSEVFGLAVTDNGVDIALSLEWWQISGDTLDTFRKSRIVRGRGILSPTCVTVVGTVVYWIDTANQVMSSVSGEIGQAIRPDLVGIVPSQTFITYHSFQTRNWLVILHGAAGKLLVYDMDLDQWQTPWPLAVAPTTIASGQTSTTNIQLVAAFPSGHVRALSPSTAPIYLDDGTPYADSLRPSLVSIIPGRGTSARNPTAVREPVQFEMEFNTTVTTDGSGNVTSYVPNLPSAFYWLRDDDPMLRPLTGWETLTIGDGTDDSPNAGQCLPLQFDTLWKDHLYVAPRRFVLTNGEYARRVTFSAEWDAATIAWRVYSLDLAMKAT